jgi:Rrf2 family protein
VLSNSADYALRAVLVLSRSFGERAIHAEEIADATGTPRNYMSKILNLLAKAGVVTSSRGPTGGFTLAVSPTNITVAQVIDVFDEPKNHTRCLLGNGPCRPEKPCGAHNCWSGVLTQRREPLLATTLNDLLHS